MENKEPFVSRADEYIFLANDQLNKTENNLRFMIIVNNTKFNTFLYQKEDL